MWASRIINENSLIIKFLIFYFLKLKQSNEKESEKERLPINSQGNQDQSILDLGLANAEYE